MGKFVLKDVVALYGGRNISGELSSISLEYSQDTPENTAFGDTHRRRLPGVLDVALTQNGWWDSIDANDSADADFFAKIGAATELYSCSPDGGQVGEIAFSFNAVANEYSPGGSHGEVFAFALNVSGDGVIARGVVMENAIFGSTADSATRTFAAAEVTDTVYSSIHVVAASGAAPTLDILVLSDATDTFTPGVTRFTIPQFTAVGSNRQVLVGAVSDTFWRHRLTLAGGTPSFTVFGALAIQKTLLP